MIDVEAGSLGRAKSLTVLAQEELGKALRVYEAFHTAWNTGDDTARPVPALSRDARSHTKKYLQAIVFAGELAEFWGDYSQLRHRQQDGESWPETFEREQREAEAQAKEANAGKQRGFYVDYDPTTDQLSSPSDTAPGAVVEDLQTAAQVVEMLLIKDHSRMKFDATTPRDSTLTQQHRLRSRSHPQDWAAAPPAFRAGAHLAAPRNSAQPDETQPDLAEPADILPGTSSQIPTMAASDPSWHGPPVDTASKHVQVDRGDATRLDVEVSGLAGAPWLVLLQGQASAQSW